MADSLQNAISFSSSLVDPKKWVGDESITKFTSLSLRYAKSAKQKNKRKSGLTAKERKRQKLYQIKTIPLNLIYELNAAWNSYAEVFFKNLPASGATHANPQSLEVLLRIDFIGAILTVYQSECNPHLIGKRGVVVMESANLFRIAMVALNPSNTIKADRHKMKQNRCDDGDGVRIYSVQKRHCVFQLSSAHFSSGSILFDGNKMLKQPIARTLKKVKIIHSKHDLAVEDFV